MPSGGANKFTYEKVKEIFSENNFQLLETEYVSNNTPMRAICSCGIEVLIRLSHVQKGNKCQQCKGKSASERMKASEKDIQQVCQANSCKFVRAWIKCKKTRIAYICKCGREAEAYLVNFKRFPNCKKCGAEKISGDKCWMYDPDREAVAMREKFRKACGQHIRRFMKATGQKKTRRTHELLGYTPQQLQDYILGHPDYQRVKDVEWHIDHIFPLKAFMDCGIFDLRIINAFDNLRPLEGPDNLVKADKYDPVEFQKWLQERK